MAEKHDAMVAKYRRTLRGLGYKIEDKSPFVDYRPDIFATRRTFKLFVEVEIEATLESNHTYNQLESMYEYISTKKKCRGILVVPHQAYRQASLQIESRFGDRQIRVVAI